MKALRFEFPVLSSTDASTFLDLVTRVDGVVAAMVGGNALEVVVGTDACALLVRAEVHHAIAAVAAGVAA